MALLSPIGASLRVYYPLVHLLVPLALMVLGFMASLLAVPDVTVAAICNGEDACPLVIYLTTVKAAVAAFGTMFITPWVGSLSDHYGRRPFFMMLFALFALPAGVFCVATNATAVYAYFAISTVVLMVGEGSFTSLFYAYVADSIPSEQRAGGFGMVGGITSVGLLAGTLIARLLPEAYVFQFAAATGLLSAVYVFFFLPESVKGLGEASGKVSHNETKGDRPGQPEHQPQPQPALRRSKSGLKEAVRIMSSSRLLMLITVIAFLARMSDAGYYGSFLFYLKATFHWGKNEFSLIVLVAGVASALSQLLLLPLISHYIGLRAVLLFGLFSGALHVVLYGIAWAPWVVYVAAGMSAFAGMVNPAVGAVVSQCGNPEEQGKLQGLVAGVRALSDFIAPICFNPITAVFISDNPPFHCPGLGLIIAGSVEFLAFFLAFLLPSLPPPVVAPLEFVAVPQDEESIVEHVAVAPVAALPPRVYLPPEVEPLLG